MFPEHVARPHQFHVHTCHQSPHEEPVPWKGASGNVQELSQSGAIVHAWESGRSPENTDVSVGQSRDDRIHGGDAEPRRLRGIHYVEGGADPFGDYWPSKVGTHERARVSGA
jgi:hypothetical protein